MTIEMNPPPDHDSAVVVLSGGQDSTTCLFWATSRYARVKAVCFDYGQRHAIEIESARKVAELAEVELEIIELPADVLAGSSPLLAAGEDEVEDYADAAALPGGIEKTFIPMRNALMLTIAANRAAVGGYMRLVTGVCEADFGGYPDCRRDFIDRLESAFQASLFGVASIFIETPLMYLSKRQTVELAANLASSTGAPFQDAPIWQALGYSHTCYKGEVPPCGTCHACLLRERGFAEAGIPDPLLQRDGTAPKPVAARKRVKS